MRLITTVITSGALRDASICPTTTPACTHRSCRTLQHNTCHRCHPQRRGSITRLHHLALSLMTKLRRPTHASSKQHCSLLPLAAIATHHAHYRYEMLSTMPSSSCTFSAAAARTGARCTGPRSDPPKVPPRPTRPPGSPAPPAPPLAAQPHSGARRSSSSGPAAEPRLL